MTAAAPIFADNTSAKIGMVVLQTDETLEKESRFYLADCNITLLHSRIPVSDTITVDTLQEMRHHLKSALSLFPQRYPFDAVAYACTSAATVIGERALDDIIHTAVRTRHASNPLSAVKAALAHIGAERIAYLAPYNSDITRAMREALGAAGHQVIASDSFNQESDHAVAMIPPDAILERLQQFRDCAADAVFIACTNLNCASVIPRAEQQLGKTVISSNQALWWHLLRSVQHPLPKSDACGRLFTLST